MTSGYSAAAGQGHAVFCPGCTPRRTIANHLDCGRTITSKGCPDQGVFSIYLWLLRPELLGGTMGYLIKLGNVGIRYAALRPVVPRGLCLFPSGQFQAVGFQESAEVWPRFGQGELA
ncbi:MAG: hypothetical protein O7A08_14860, partial [SAR324 cluster bacterium]|nr:hypothetical protein [SAR324 cluster bacterium]